MPRIVIPDDCPAVMSLSQPYRVLAQEFEVGCHQTLPGSEEELIERIGDAEVAICVRASSRFTEAVFGRCPSLRQVSLWGTGTDNVDLAAARDHGVTVTNTPGVSAIAIAEHCLALMLGVARAIPRIDAETRAGSWPRGQVAQMHGKTLGIIGLGAIGRRFAKLGQAVGMRVITWTMHPKPELGFEAVSLEDIYRESDVVSIHLRLSDDTRGMIRRDQFQMMKPTAILLNTARGPIVEESALVEALQSGTIAGAGLDVFDAEPLPSDHPITSLANVVLTPHSAGITAEALEAGLQMAMDNVRNLLAGRPTNVVTGA